MICIQEPELRCHAREWSTCKYPHALRSSLSTEVYLLYLICSHIPTSMGSSLIKSPALFPSPLVPQKSISQRNNLSKQERSLDWKAQPLEWAPGKNISWKRNWKREWERIGMTHPPPVEVHSLVKCSLKKKNTKHNNSHSRTKLWRCCLPEVHHGEVNAKHVKQVHSGNKNICICHFRLWITSQ